jgi:hypothetical protein
MSAKEKEELDVKVKSLFQEYQVKGTFTTESDTTPKPRD